MKIKFIPISCVIVLGCKHGCLKCLKNICARTMTGNINWNFYHKTLEKLGEEKVVPGFALAVIKNNEITKFGTIINLKSLGLEHYKIFFTFNNNKYSDTEIFNYLKNQKGIYWASRVGGRYDLHTTIFVKDFQELDRFIDKFNQEFPNLIKDYKSCYVLELSIYNHKYLSDIPKIIKYGYNDKIKTIDNLDNHILNKIKCLRKHLVVLTYVMNYKIENNRPLNGVTRAICYSGFREGQHPDRGDGAINPSYDETLEDLNILSKDNNLYSVLPLQLFWWPVAGLPAD